MSTNKKFSWKPKKTIKTVFIEFAVIFVSLLPIIFLMIPGISKCLNERTVEVTVSDKGIKRAKASNKQGAADKYLIYTDVGTYEITDSLFKWRWDSSDLYGQIKVGEVYEFKVAGFRIPILSVYPNIYEAVLIE